MANQHIPLAERIRPKRIEDVVGQFHLLGPTGILSKLVSLERLPSMVFWGAPGTGKTTLARILALATKHQFLEISGATGSTAELKQTISDHKKRTLFQSMPPIIFLDEIHRFNRAQQDILLSPLERGEIILLGATTENPIFHLNQALLSRCHILALTLLQPEEIQLVLERTWSQERPNEPRPCKAIKWLSHWAGGDLRSAIAGLEILLALENKDATDLKEVLGNRISYNKTNGHYDLASAFQKSLRGSDPDASLYYLSRMIQVGEDPRFIARRLIICAAEDIGNADPQALLLSESVSRAIEHIGWPEARILLAQAVIYVANAPKSNAVVTAIDAAMAAPDAPIPDALTKNNHALKNNTTVEHEKYFYSHQDYSRTQKFLPLILQSDTFYRPTRPQERNWNDLLEPNLTQLEYLLTVWTTTNPNGGEMPVNNWAAQLGCSREAVARAIVKLSCHNWNIERILIARPIAAS